MTPELPQFPHRPAPAPVPARIPWPEWLLAMACIVVLLGFVGLFLFAALVIGCDLIWQ